MKRLASIVAALCKRHALILFTVCAFLSAPTAHAIIDENENGLSDLWEKNHNNNELFPATYDPEADSDQDGWTNAEEAAAGTDPADPNPPDGLVRPYTTHIPATYHDPDEDGIPDILTPETITLTWPTIPGKKYTLLVSTDLAPESWLPCGEEATFIGNGNDVTYGFPTSISAKSFWRIAVTDTDSDEDGLSNAEEHALGSNPESADSDGDHLADGEEVTMGTDPADSQSDPDGIPDDQDADPTDGRIDWEKSLPYRYALFPLELQGTHVPKQVNNLGDVLYDGNLLFRAAQFTSLPQAVGPPNVPDSLSTCEAIVMDDGGRIYGRGNVALNPTGSGSSCWVTWPAGGGTPSALADASAYASYNGIQQDLPRDMHFTTQTDGTRRFIAIADVPYAIGGGMQFRGLNHPSNSNYAWTLSGGDGTTPLTVTRDENPAGINDFAISPFGEIMTTLNEDGLPVAVGGVSFGTYSLKRITKLPSGREIALGSFAPPLVSNNGQWEEVPGFKGNCVEASADTGFVFREDGKIWQNGQVWEGKDVFPELHSGTITNPTDFPESMHYWDASPTGFLLASHSTSNSSGQTSMMHCLGIPVMVKNGATVGNIIWQGVDDTSVTARKSDSFGTNTATGSDPNGRQNRIWIMAPAGTDTTNADYGSWAVIHVPEMIDGATLKIVPKDSRIQISPNTFAAGDVADIKLTASPGASLDSGLKFELAKTGNLEKTTCYNYPIGVKIMKKRIVKLTVHPMALQRTGQADNPPEFFPAANPIEIAATEAKLESILNDIYGEQVNAFFEVSVLAPLPAKYEVVGADGKGTGYFKADIDTPEAKILTDGRLSPSLTTHIDVWALGGVTFTETGKPAGLAEKIAYTFYDQSGNSDSMIVVNGDLGNLTTGVEIETAEAEAMVFNSLAHEIGHVMIGGGHPDQESGTMAANSFGPARLDGTERSLRLMRKSSGNGPPATLLVKREWDKIENWLKHQEDLGYLPP